MTAAAKKPRILFLCTGNSCRNQMPGTRITHAGFEDPPRLAANAPTGEVAMRHDRRFRDEIRVFVETLPDALDPTRIR